MGLVLSAWEGLDEATALKAHPQYPEWLRIRRELATLSQLRVFNEWMHTNLLSLETIPLETIRLVMAWAAYREQDR